VALAKEMASSTESTGVIETIGPKISFFSRSGQRQPLFALRHRDDRDRLKDVFRPAFRRPDAGGKRGAAQRRTLRGAQLMARSRSDLKLFDALIDNFRGSGLIPA
jgi:hypothetical protein